MQSTSMTSLAKSQSRKRRIHQVRQHIRKWERRTRSLIDEHITTIISHPTRRRTFKAMTILASPKGPQHARSMTYTKSESRWVAWSLDYKKMHGWCLRFLGRKSLQYTFVYEMLQIFLLGCLCLIRSLLLSLSLLI